MDLPGLLHDLQNPAVSPADKIIALQKIRLEYADGDHKEEFIKAGGVAVLVKAVVTDWPQRGELEASLSEFDVTVKITDKCLSMRRVAVETLADMSNIKAYVRAYMLAMLLAHFPKLLTDLCRKPIQAEVDQSNQCHILLERIVWIMANTVLQQAGFEVCSQCLPIVVNGFDGFNPNAYMHRRPGQQPDQYMCTFVKFLSSLLAAARKLGPEQTQRTLQGMVSASTIDRLKQLPDNAISGPMTFTKRILLHDIWEFWEATVLKLVQPLQATIATLKAESHALKDEGNAAFAAGRLEEAAEKYSLAVARYSGNGMAACNKALCMLRLGQTVPAFDCAQWAIMSTPDWGKAWARMAAVLMTQERKTHAKRCFETAVRLDPSIEAQRGSVLSRPAAPNTVGRLKRAQLDAFADRMEHMVGAEAKAKALRIQQDMSWSVSFAAYDGNSGHVAGDEPMFVFTVTGDRSNLAIEFMPSFPVAEVAVKILLRCMVQQGVRPGWIYIAYRMACMLPELKARLEPLNMRILMGTKYEAVYSATAHGNDYHGMNGVPKDRYRHLLIDT